MVKKVNAKPVSVVKTTSAQSLLQSNQQQQHFPPQQIQVSTSVGVQTIRLSGHSLLQSAQPNAATSANVQSVFPTKIVQSQAQQQQQSILTTQPGKSILQTSNLKQQQPQQSQQQQSHVLPTKLLASQIKLGVNANNKKKRNFLLYNNIYKNTEFLSFFFLF